MDITLYHGSENIIEKPSFGFHNAGNDFGSGFYCTENPDLAKEWAVDDGRDGFASIYKLDLDGLKVLNLGDERCSVLHWMSMLAANRSEAEVSGKEWLRLNFPLPANEYDIIIGYRADDGYYQIAEDFLRNYLPLQGLVSALHLGDWGEQIVLKSEKAFSRIRFVGSETAQHKEFYVRRENRNAEAFNRYGEIIQEFVDVYHEGEIRLNQIVAGVVSLDDPRLWIK